MRNSILVLAIALGLEPGASAAMRAAPPAPIDGGRIAQLITQLGSTKFKEREAATQALDAIGGPALEALQRAARSSDPEVGRRAQNLAHLIRKRVETAQFLEPLRLRLVYQDTPVVQAVEDFAKRTGFPIAIAGSRARLANRKIRLDTGETSFWEAFDQFCRKAGLVERTATPESDLHTRRLGETTKGGQKPVVPIGDASSSLSPARGWDGRLSLLDGKPPLLPTYHAGAVRIRALPATGRVPETAKDETLFLVEITPQPKTAWHNILDLRIDKALDENGQDLAPSLETRGDGGRLAAMGNAVLVWDAQTGRPLTAPRDIPVRFKSGDRPSGTLKEVKGVVAAQVQTASQAILAVDNVLRSEGQTVVGPDGESLKVIEAKRQPNGDVHVRVELNDASQANAFWAAKGGVLRANRVVIANGVIRQRVVGGGGDGTAPTNLVLQDAQGQSFPLGSRGEEMVLNGNTMTREVTLVYHSRAGRGEPRKLVYLGRRTLIIEVPFTLKDVPLR